MKTLNALIFTLLLISNNAFSQSCELKGTVTNPQDVPVPGVNIIVKGTSMVTVSDIHGRFKFRIPEGNNIILYQLIGFRPLEQQILTSVDSTYESTVTLIKDKDSKKKLRSSAVLSSKAVQE